MITRNLTGGNSASRPGENLSRTRSMTPCRAAGLCHDGSRLGGRPVNDIPPVRLPSTAYQQVFPYPLLVGARPWIVVKQSRPALTPPARCLMIRDARQE